MKLNEKYNLSAIVPEAELGLHLEATLAVAKLESYKTYHFKMEDEHRGDMTWGEFWSYREKSLRENFEAKKGATIAGIARKRIKDYPELAEKHLLRR
jgi:hypothetical protein